VKLNYHQNILQPLNPSRIFLFLISLLPATNYIICVEMNNLWYGKLSGHMLAIETDVKGCIKSKHLTISKQSKSKHTENTEVPIRAAQLSFTQFWANGVWSSVRALNLSLNKTDFPCNPPVNLWFRIGPFFLPTEQNLNMPISYVPQIMRFYELGHFSTIIYVQFLYATKFHLYS
jgi:hypothetical protein